MVIPIKKLRNGFEMPVFGLGTWAFGENPSERQKEIDLIKKAVDLGITHIDTAEVYGHGEAEKVVGEAIKGMDRKRLFLVSKVYGNHLGYEDLINSFNYSTERMGVEYLDMYLLHRYNPSVPLKETMTAMDYLYEHGLIKNIGISNYTVNQTIEAIKNSKNKVVANQLHLNLKYREAEKKGLLKYCQDEDMMFIAWRPLKNIDLKNQLVLEMSKKYSKTPTQIALNWLVSQKNVVTLSKTSHIEHLKENLGSFDFKLEAEDVELLRNSYPNQEYVSNVVPLSE